MPAGGKAGAQLILCLALATPFINHFLLDDSTGTSDSMGQGASLLPMKEEVSDWNRI